MKLLLFITVLLSMSKADDSQAAGGLPCDDRAFCFTEKVTILEQTVLTDQTEEFKNFDLRYQPHTRQFRTGGVVEFLRPPMPTTREGWLAAIDAWLNFVQDTTLDEVRIQGIFIGQTAEKELLLRGEEELFFSKNFSNLLSTLRSENFWRLLHEPIAMDSLQLHTKEVRRLEHVVTLNHGKFWSEKERCVLEKNLRKNFVGLSAEAETFFKNASLGQSLLFKDALTGMEIPLELCKAI